MIIYYLYQFQQLRYSSLIPSLLSLISYHHFHDILQTHFDYHLYLTKIQNYLIQEYDLQFKRNQKQMLQSQQSIMSMVKIILFLIMKHQIKKQFVPRILQSQEESQMYLMGEIKRVQTWLQKRVQVKEAHYTIEQLEQQNECLSKKLKQIQAKNNNLSTLRRQIQQQTKRIQRQNKDNNDEKVRIVDELQMTNHKQYMVIYKDLIVDRNQLISSHEKVQSQINELAIQNQEMLGKIAENMLIIDHLNEQIRKYKRLQSRASKSAISYNKNDKENICAEPFQSVRMVQSIKVHKSNENDQHISHSILQEKYFDCQANVQNASQDLAPKLQQMGSKIKLLDQQILNSKTLIEKLLKLNKRKQRIIREAQQQCKQFSLRYADSIMK